MAKFAPNGAKIVWEPLPGSQTLALTCPANIVVYHGTRGPGKTDAQIMRFRRNVGQGYGRYWRGIILDREYKNLDDIASKALRWFPEFEDGAKFHSGKADYKWVWPSGEELLFRSVKKDTDYWDYHGQEFPFIGWNELTKYPSDVLFEAMMSCNRSSFLPSEKPIYIDGKHFDQSGEIVIVPQNNKRARIHYLKDIPLEVFVTTNPFGPGHNWVKKKFISVAKPGRIHKTRINVFDPRIQERRDVELTQVHLFGTYKENRYLDAKYVAQLESITDENKRKAWLGGDWDIVAGGIFDDVWDKEIHVLRPFDIPSNWMITRSFDWGESKPFSVGWWAVSNGSDVKLSDGSWMSTVKGDLFRINEWYGCGDKPNHGLRLLATKVAEGIVERQLEFGIQHRVFPGPADNSINDIDNGKSIADDMAKPVRVNGNMYPGVVWSASNKKPYSRSAGWKQIRQALANAKPNVISVDGVVKHLPREHPGIFIFNTCVNFIDQIPVLSRSEDDPDDIDTDCEDHIADEVRYMVLSTTTGVHSSKTVG